MLPKQLFEFFIFFVVISILFLTNNILVFAGAQQCEGTEESCLAEEYALFEISSIVICERGVMAGPSSYFQYKIVTKAGENPGRLFIENNAKERGIRGIYEIPVDDNVIFRVESNPKKMPLKGKPIVRPMGKGVEILSASQRDMNALRESLIPIYYPCWLR